MNGPFPQPGGKSWADRSLWALGETERGGASPQPAQPADPKFVFLSGTVVPRLWDTTGRVRLTWAASEQGSWQCSMRGIQAFFTSALKKCFLEILTSFASFPKRMKAFRRSSPLSCGRDGQTCVKAGTGRRKPSKTPAALCGPFYTPWPLRSPLDHSIGTESLHILVFMTFSSLDEGRAGSEGAPLPSRAPPPAPARQGCPKSLCGVQGIKRGISFPNSRAGGSRGSSNERFFLTRSILCSPALPVTLTSVFSPPHLSSYIDWGGCGGEVTRIRGSSATS